MQDFRRYSYKVTPNQLKQIQKEVDHIIVIINGEYYDLIEDENEAEEAERLKGCKYEFLDVEG